MQHDPVSSPSHYTAYSGLEVIDLTEQMNFNRGNAVKYICRAGLKTTANEIEDLEKAAWYIRREIDRLKKDPPTKPVDRPCWIEPLTSGTIKAVQVSDVNPGYSRIAADVEAVKRAADRRL